jgi:hypothetical protein
MKPVSYIAPFADICFFHLETSLNRGRKLKIRTVLLKVPCLWKYNKILKCIWNCSLKNIDNSCDACLIFCTVGFQFNADIPRMVYANQIPNIFFSLWQFMLYILTDVSHSPSGNTFDLFVLIRAPDAWLYSLKARVTVGTSWVEFIKIVPSSA